MMILNSLAGRTAASHGGWDGEGLSTILYIWLLRALRDMLIRDCALVAGILRYRSEYLKFEACILFIIFRSRRCQYTV